MKQTSCECCDNKGWLFTGLGFERCDACCRFDGDQQAIEHVNKLAWEREIEYKNGIPKQQRASIASKSR